MNHYRPTPLAWKKPATQIPLSTENGKKSNGVLEKEETVECCTPRVVFLFLQVVFLVSLLRVFT
jgi:hypothetical protein